MARTTKTPSSKSKDAKTIKDNSSQTSSKKPLHQALGPASQDFGQEIKPLGKEVGELTVKTVRTLLIKPVSSVVWGLENASEWISQKVSEKLKDKSPDELKEPDPRIALPTLQALIYSGNNQDILEMFSNLLAGEMTKNSSSEVHPAFVELIKQMTSLEAKVLSHIYEDSNQAKFDIRLFKINNPEQFNPIASLLSFSAQDGDNINNDDLMVAVSNLERLGLVFVDSEHHQSSEVLNKSIADLQERYDNKIDISTHRIEVHTSGIYLTPLAKRFTKICLPSPMSSDKPDENSQT